MSYIIVLPAISALIGVIIGSTIVLLIVEKDR